MKIELSNMSTLRLLDTWGKK